ncbi:MAG: hypothetical protein RLZZ385_562 [Pseudomonadota bacterium]|jgi:hypothetical protein
MLRLKPYTAEEWADIERQGFARYYWNYIVETFVVVIAIFAAINFVVYFDRQTELMVAGFLSVLVFAPTSGIGMWYMLKAKFHKAGRQS